MEPCTILTSHILPVHPCWIKVLILYLLLLSPKMLNYSVDHSWSTVYSLTDLRFQVSCIFMEQSTN